MLTAGSEEPLCPVTPDTPTFTQGAEHDIPSLRAFFVFLFVANTPRRSVIG